MRVACVGAGFSGAVIARELAEKKQWDVDVYDARPHIAGNCHTERDPQTGIMLHTYGPHIFHTSDEEVWNYVQRFGKFNTFTNRVKAITKEGVFSLPINLLTINQLFNKKLSPAEAKTFLQAQSDKSIKDPTTFEEQALSMLGEKLYRTFFLGYTKKQWGVSPKDLPASILKRLPVRFSYDDNYYNSTFQGIPVDGYTKIVESILSHKNIKVILNTKFLREQASDYDHVFYSGPIDAWFNFDAGRLRYRTLKFEKFYAEGDFQGNAVLNYCEEDVPFTRITEHKHFTPWENHPDQSVCFREYSSECGAADIPYYPLRLTHDKELLQQYVTRAQQCSDPITFVGRLGTYRYLDMHIVIKEALNVAAAFMANPTREFSKFSENPI